MMPRRIGDDAAPMNLPEHIASVLAPHLGAQTADAVARHLCAKHQVGEGPIDPEKARMLQDTIRRGLVAFVGPERAVELARLCFEPHPGG
jgi:hypothetical protein